MIILEYHYQLFYPAGNDTALVFGIDYNPKERVLINNAIMEKHKNIEQVGFISVENNNRIFFMAGGGFCGNGTRAAVWSFLQGKQSNIHITIPDVSNCIYAGITDNGDVWTDIPKPEEITVTQISQGMYIVNMIGVSHIIVLPENSIPYLDLKKGEQLKTAKRLLEHTGLIYRSSCGVIYTMKTEKGFKIIPCVHDLGVDTMIQETACGTGSIAVAITQSVKNRKSVSIMIEQPSGETIKATTFYEDESIKRAVISGPVRCDTHVLSGAVLI